MIDNFYHQIETELGPLSSDWFEELTAKACKDGRWPVEEEEEEKEEEEVTVTTSHTEDDLFRVPLQTQGLEDQLSSTPRIFRQREPQSPDLVLGRSPEPETQSPLSAYPWMNSSPYLFGSAKKQKSQRFEKDCGPVKRSDFFGLFDTPKGSVAQDCSAKRISESLGAQLNPDLSWSSSFNTPSVLSPTVILSKKEAEPSPVNLLKDKEVIIVRKLFPTLSKDVESTSEPTSTARLNDEDDQTKTKRVDESFDSVEGVWRQTVPDAIKDGDVRDTVESVLDGAEDALSIFFSNSDSALRRVKTRERTKRVSSALKEVKSAALTTQNSTDQTSGLKQDPDVNMLSNCDAETKSSIKNSDFTQWTPLSLSDVPDSKTRQVCTSELANEPNSVTQNSQLAASGTVEKQKRSPDFYPERSQLRSSLLLVSPALTFSRKPRKFVYQVQSPSPSTKGRKQNNTSEKASHTVTDDLTGKHYEEASLSKNNKQNDDRGTTDTAGHADQPKETPVKQVNPAALIDPGLDMTQLCKAFAEDFTQEVNFTKKSPNKHTQHDDSGFITSVCTTQNITGKAGHDKLCDGTARQDFHSNNKETSGCSDMFSDLSGVTASRSEPGFQIASNKVIFVPPEAVMKAKAVLDDQHTTSTASLHKTESPKASNNSVLSTRCSSGSHGFKSGGDFTSNGSTDDVSSSFLFQTNESGFKTASNRSISISSVHLEKAKDIFKELEAESFDLHPSSSGKVDVQNVKFPKSDFRRNQSNHNGPDGNSTLTASQKADVTELCSLLEEADSQCEFTQFRKAKSASDSDGLRCEKEWDADILSGIDFDDSFNCDTDRQVSRNLQVRPNQHTTVLNSVNKEDEKNRKAISKSRSVHLNVIDDDKDQKNRYKNISKSCFVQSNAKPPVIDDKVMEKAYNIKSNTKPEQFKPFSLDFKTAGGASVNISEKHLSKARSLFADLEDCEEDSGLISEHRTSKVKEKQKESNEHLMETSHGACSAEKTDLKAKPDGEFCNGNVSAVMKDVEECKQMCRTANLETVQRSEVSFGFSTAGGKELKVSAKSLLNARKLLNEDANFEDAPNNDAVVSRKSFYATKPKPNAAIWSKTSVEKSNALKIALQESNMSDTSLKDSGEENCENSSEIKWKMSAYQSQQSIQNNGFKMANGKEVSVSAAAVETSKSIFKDVDSSTDETKSKDKIANLDLEAQKSRFVNGFKMASGKGVSVSEEAFKKSKAVFKDCDPDCSDNSADKSSVMDNCGFRAAVGNTVRLPEIDSLNKEALSLKDQPTVLKKYVEKEFTPTSSEKLGSTSGCGFSTASGKVVSVSAEALHRAKAVFADSSDASPYRETMEILEDEIPKTIFSDAVPGSKSKSAISDKKTSIFSEYEDLASCKNFLDPQKTKQSDVDRTRCLGFSTASGKVVSVSAEALHRAKAVFTDTSDASPYRETMEILEDEIPKTIFSDAVPGRSCSLRKSKSVVSDKTLQKKTSIFSESEDLASCVNPPKTKQTDVEQTRCLGFSTASGKGVVVSEKALKDGKAVFAYSSNASPCEETMEILEDQIPKTNSNAVPGSKSKSAISDKTLHKKTSVFSKCEDLASCKNFLDPQKTKQSDVDRTRCLGFSTASGKGVSVSAEALHRAKAVFTDSSDASPYRETMEILEDEIPKTIFSDAVPGSRSKSAISDKGLQMKTSVFSECEDLASCENFLDPQKTKQSDVDRTRCLGFSTASGKGVSVSAEALHRAKAVFADSSDASPCEETMEILEEEIPKTFSDAVPGRSYGLSKSKSAISDKTLQKKTSIFSECKDLASCKNFLDPQKTKQSDVEQIRCLGFSTASGKGVVVSEKALKDGKAVFADCDNFLDDKQDVESHLNVQKGQHKTCKTTLIRNSNNTGISEAKFEKEDDANSHIGARNIGFSTASGKDVSVSKSALQVAFKMFRDCDVETVINDQHQQTKISEHHSTKLTEKCPQVASEPKIGPTEASNHSISVQNKMISDNPALLNCSSLNLNAYTITQQRYFEQEAVACTKALLEDDFTENSLVEPLEDSSIRKSPAPPQQRPFQETGGQRKHTSDDGLTAQPPLKRRLISEFDQISDTRVCSPVKSSPNGALKDRRVFKYNQHLKPNITHSSWSAKDQNMVKQEVQALISDEQQRGAVVFVPPFRKNMKPNVQGVDPEAQNRSNLELKKNNMTSDHVRSSSQFSRDSGSACENKISIELKHHTVEKRDCEDVKKPKEDGADTEQRTFVPTKEKDPAQDPETWQQSLQLAQDMQDMRIRKKKRQTIRPLPGSFYLAKTSGVTRISLREAVHHKCPVQHTQKQLYQFGVHCKVSQITSENAESFRFRFDDFFKREMIVEDAGVHLADGGWLIPDKGGTVGKEEFYRALCDTPGVDPKLISEAWVFNHYRWIVWKRACMERVFPEVMGSRCLTPEQVLLQLKLRYDTEVDHSQRSALKKIMERDDTPAKTLVLCVCSIFTSNHSEEEEKKLQSSSDAKPEFPLVVVWLTDGWYSIKALLDAPLSVMLQKGRLRVGEKIIIHGAELIGSQEACSPLEAPDSLMLKISANSTRRARWDTKLGFHKDPRPFTLPLSSLYPNGGVVACVDIVVLRSYPTQWMEKTPGGVFVFRNDRAEDREARRHSSAKQKTMELLFTKIQAQFEKEEEEKRKNRRRRRRRFKRNEIENLQDGEEIYEAMENDPAYVQAHLSVCQMEAVNSYRCVLAERKQTELQDRLRRAVQEDQESESCRDREVTPVWKLAIADYTDLHSNCIYTLNIWRPSVELRSLLKEGCRYKAYHLTTSETKKRSGTANIQFTTTKKTQFQDMQVCPDWLSAHFPVRQLTRFRDLQQSGFTSPCGEVDVVGCLISILDRQGSSPVLYLVDERFEFVSVRLFSSLVQQAQEDLLKPSSLLAISNLQLRDLSGPVPRLYAAELTLFSVNPKEAHLQEALTCLKTFVQGYENFFIVAEEKLSNLIPQNSLKSIQSPRTLGVPSMPKPNGRMNVTPQQSRVYSAFTPVSRRSPAPVQSTEAKDPKSLKRKRGLDYLSRVPSPPPLNSLSITTPPSVKKTFNPPRRSGTPRPAHTHPELSSAPPAEEEEWVNDEELAMINTQALLN